jgi:hypothetical protein
MAESPRFRRGPVKFGNVMPQDWPVDDLSVVGERIKGVATVLGQATVSSRSGGRPGRPGRWKGEGARAGPAAPD